MQRNLGIHGLLLMSTFHDFYPNQIITKDISSQFPSRYIIKKDNTWIHDTIFIEIKHLDTGGAIRMEGDVGYYMVIEKCVFSSCESSSGLGGAVYMSNNYGSMAISEVCAHGCVAKSGGSTFCLGSENTKIVLNNSVLTNSRRVYSSEGGSCINMYSGQYILNQINISYTIGNDAVFDATNANSIQTTFCSMISNIADYSGIIRVYNCQNSSFVQSNILNNTQFASYSGVIYADKDSEVSIVSCVFLDNPMNGYLFSARDSSITVVSCSIQQNAKNNGANIYDARIDGTPLQLSHMQTHLCKPNSNSNGNSTSLKKNGIYYVIGILVIACIAAYFIKNGNLSAAKSSDSAEFQQFK